MQVRVMEFRESSDRSLRDVLKDAYLGGWRLAALQTDFPRGLEVYPKHIIVLEKDE